MEWVKKHKILTVVIVLIVLGVIGAATGDKSQTTTSNQSGVSQSSSPAPTEKPKLDIASFYAKVQNGMTKDAVVALAEKDPGSCTESETQGIGKYEFCNWYGSFGDNAFASVTFQDGKVQSKSKSGF